MSHLWVDNAFLSPVQKTSESIACSTMRESRKSYREVFIVSLQEMAETNVGAQIPALAGSGAAVPPVDLPVFQEIWRFLALIVLFILLFEWVWYHRVRT